MKEVIDLYTKILIGTFSFIGPFFTLLITLFYAALEKSKERHDAKLKNINETISRGDSNQKQNSKKLLALLNENQKEINLLTPKRQIRRWAISLVVSIIFIGFYNFQHSHFWNEKIIICPIFYKIFALTLSMMGFCYCVWVLWQVFCTIIKSKEEEEKSKKEKLVKRSFGFKSSLRSS